MLRLGSCLHERFFNIAWFEILNFVFKSIKVREDTNQGGKSSSLFLN